METNSCVIRHLGRPKIVAAIAFFASDVSDDASYVTGIALCVDSDRADLDTR